MNPALMKYKLFTLIVEIIVKLIVVLGNPNLSLPVFENTIDLDRRAYDKAI